jgi:hypothetical protein
LSAVGKPMRAFPFRIGGTDLLRRSFWR